MKKKDIFQIGEERIWKWIGNHYTGLSIIMIISSIWVAFSITIISLASVIGANEIVKNIQLNYDKGLVTQQAYDIIMNVFVPVFMYAVNTMTYIVVIIGMVCAIYILYFGYRAAYRWRKDNL